MSERRTVRILAIDRLLPGVTLEQMAPHFEAESRHAWQLYKQGLFREILFRQDHPGVVISMECFDLDEAKAILAELPLVKAGLIEFDLIPVGAFPMWETLFRPAE